MTIVRRPSCWPSIVIHPVRKDAPQARDSRPAPLTDKEKKMKRSGGKILAALMAALCLLPAAAKSHFVWVERDAEGPARAYFGEWQYGEIEKTGGRLDKIVPSATAGADKKALKQERREDHIALAVKGGGDVRLVESTQAPREDKKNGGFTRSIFQAKAGRAETAARLDLELVPVKAGGNDFVLMFKGKPLPKADLVVFGPPRWEKPLQTDAEGRVTVPTPWAGRYVLKASQLEPGAGTLNGAAYDRTRTTFTLTFVQPDGIAWTEAIAPAAMP